MSKIDKLIAKFYKKPIPNDITFGEVETLFKHLGCIIDSGANHPKVIHKESGTIIPIPGHKKLIEEYNAKQLKDLLDQLLGE